MKKGTQICLVSHLLNKKTYIAKTSYLLIFNNEMKANSIDSKEVMHFVLDYHLHLREVLIPLIIPLMIPFAFLADSIVCVLFLKGFTNICNPIVTSDPP